MAFDILSAALLDELVDRGARSPRRRQHYNLHSEYADPVQRLLNAIGVDSYIRPHRHLLDPKRECLMAVRGRLALIAFAQDGAIAQCVPFGNGPGDAAGVELDPEQWHTVIALTPGAILFEVKAGPFDPAGAKEMAPWSPEEGSAEATAYLAHLRGIAPSAEAADDGLASSS